MAAHEHQPVSRRLGENLLHDAGRAAVGEALLAAVGMVDEPGVVEAEQVEDRGLEVVGRDDVLDGAVADLVGRAVGHAALDAAAGQPDREALAVVVAAGLGVELALADGSRPISPPQWTIVVSSSPRCFRSFTSAAAGWSVRRQIAGRSCADGVVVVPRLAAEEELHEPHAALDQPAGDQAARAVLAGRGPGRGRTAGGCRSGSLEMSSASLAAVCMAAASS